MKDVVHLAEFQQILEDKQHPYQPSLENQKIVQSTDIVLFAGITNAGRNTVIKKLMPEGKYYFVISDTTRAPKERNGVMETNGVEYWFRDEETVLQELHDGAFVEAAIIHGTQVSGMSVREIAKAKAQNKTAVTDIEIAGVESVRAIKPDVVCLFFLPAGFDSWITRIQKRGDLDTVEISRRLQTATKELQAAIDRPYYWFVINDSLENTVDYTRSLIKSRKPDPAKQAAGRALAQTLLEKTQAFLEQNHG